ncbi:YEATS family protein [Aphelenchoides avenae]|nr:YEATS family protein [Aphelenchus avenae]
MTSKTETLVRLRVGHDTKKLSHPTEQQHTHRWTVFVRATGEDFKDNSFVRGVTFTLHESFENPVVKVKQPPFEVTRTGWGGFMMVIGVQFAGVSKPYSFNFDLNFSLTEDSHEELVFTLAVHNPPKGFAELCQKYSRNVKQIGKPDSRPPSTTPWKEASSSSKDSSRKEKFSSAVSSSNALVSATSSGETPAARTTTPVPPKFAPRKGDKPPKDSPSDRSTDESKEKPVKKAEKHKPAEKKERSLTEDIDSLFEDKPPKASVSEEKVEPKKPKDLEKQARREQDRESKERVERRLLKKLNQSKEHKSEKRESDGRDNPSGKPPTEKQPEKSKLKVPSLSRPPSENRLDKNAKAEDVSVRVPTPSEKPSKSQKSDDGSSSSRKRPSDNELPVSPPEAKTSRPPSSASTAQYTPASSVGPPKMSAVMSLPRIPKKEPKEPTREASEPNPRPPVSSSERPRKKSKRERDESSEPREAKRDAKQSSSSLHVPPKSMKSERLSPVPPPTYSSVAHTPASNSSTVSTSPASETTLEEKRRRLEESLPVLTDPKLLYRCCKVLIDTIPNAVFMDEATGLQSLDCDLSELPADAVLTLYKMLA